MEEVMREKSSLFQHMLSSNFECETKEILSLFEISK